MKISARRFPSGIGALFQYRSLRPRISSKVAVEPRLRSHSSTIDLHRVAKGVIAARRSKNRGEARVAILPPREGFELSRIVHTASCWHGTTVIRGHYTQLCSN